MLWLLPSWLPSQLCKSWFAPCCSFPLLWLPRVSAMLPHIPRSFAQSPKTITSLIVNHLRAGSNRFVSVDLAVLKAILPVYTSHKLP